MTLEARDKLICDLIKENPDATIKDYLEVCKEITGIEQATDLVSVENNIVKKFMNKSSILFRLCITVLVWGKLLANFFVIDKIIA